MRLIRRSRYLVGLCVACLCACAAVDWFYFLATTVFPDEQRYVASALRLAQTGEILGGRRPRLGDARHRPVLRSNHPGVWRSPSCPGGARRTVGATHRPSPPGRMDDVARF